MRFKNGTAPCFGIIGSSLWGNRGAEAMTVTAIGEMRKKWPEATFKLFSYFSQRDRQLVKDSGVEVVDAAPFALAAKHTPFAFAQGVTRLVGIKFPIMPREAAALRECDMLLDVLGISFSDGREKFLLHNIPCLWPAVLMGVPVVKLSQAIGPFNNPLNRAAARLSLPFCRKIFARGKGTERHLEEFGLPREKWEPAADVAFLYDPAYSLTNEGTEGVDHLLSELDRRASGREGLVIVSPSSVVYGKCVKKGIDYYGRMLHLLERLAARKLDVLVIPNATRAGIPSPRNNDLFVMETLREKSKALGPVADRMLWVDFDVNTHGLRRLIERGDLLIASRFHAMIAGLALGVATMAVGWGHKYAEVLEAFGLQDFSIDFASDPEQVFSKIDEAWARRSEMAERIRAGLPAVKASSARQFDYVRSSFE